MLYLKSLKSVDLTLFFYLILKANRKIKEILIRDNGFSKTEVIVSEGEVDIKKKQRKSYQIKLKNVNIFQKTLWFSVRSRKLAPQTRRTVSTEGDDSRPAAAESQVDDPAWLRSLEECSIVQVINSDESGHVYKPVVGGYKFTRIGDEKVLVKFKLAGDYWFKLTNHPSTQNLPLLKVSVVREEPLNLIITDEGFLPKIIRIGLLIRQSI